MHRCPWSTNQLKKLSRHIRDDTRPPPGLPLYAEVMRWFNEVAADVQDRISRRDWNAVLGDRPYEVISRAKTIDTLRQKLRRDPATPLSSVQDIAGVRFEAEMSLDEQDAIVNEIARMFDVNDDGIRDLRASPHSGYRAVHLWLRLPCRVEVQVRTHLQGVWANVYELAADIYGREIRYGELPESEDARSIVSGLQVLSTEHIAQTEHDRSRGRRARSAADTIEDRTGERLPVDTGASGSRLKELPDEQVIQNGLRALREHFEELRDTRRT